MTTKHDDDHDNDNNTGSINSFLQPYKAMLPHDDEVAVYDQEQEQLEEQPLELCRSGGNINRGPAGWHRRCHVRRKIIQSLLAIDDVTVFFLRSSWVARDACFECAVRQSLTLLVLSFDQKACEAPEFFDSSFVHSFGWCSSREIRV